MDLHLRTDEDGRIDRYDAADHNAPMVWPGHRHEELEINLIQRGWVEYVIEDRRIRFPRHAAAWLLPAQGHLLIDRSPDLVMWIGVFRPDLVRRLARDAQAARLARWLHKPPADTLCRVLDADTAADLSDLCKKLAPPGPGPGSAPAPGTDLDPRPPSTQRQRIGLAWLLSECWRAYGAAADVPAGVHLHPAVEHAARWLHDHAHEPQADDLDALAHRCHVSRPWLSTLFAQQIGLPLGEFRSRQRLRRFRELLAQRGRWSLTQAAYAAGFGSYAQCFRVTRRLTGRSPRQLQSDGPADRAP